MEQENTGSAPLELDMQVLAEGRSRIVRRAEDEIKYLDALNATDIQECARLERMIEGINQVISKRNNKKNILEEFVQNENSYNERFGATVKELQALGGEAISRVMAENFDQTNESSFDENKPLIEEIREDSVVQETVTSPRITPDSGKLRVIFQELNNTGPIVRQRSPKNRWTTE